MTQQSNLQKGNRFRDEIAELLKISGFRVERETLVDHKNIDVLASRNQFGKVYNIAIEAKNLKRPLNKTDVETIVASHLSILQSGKIDELLIVSTQTIEAPAAHAFLRETKGVRHLTYDQLLQSIIDFEQYLNGFIERHENTGLENYYIPQNTKEGESIVEWLSNWIADDLSVQPTAVIASYGMGKTSLAGHLAYTFSKKYLTNGKGRIPILVSLGSVSQEQNLSGLVSHALTDQTPPVQNYSFRIFEKLNEAGCFIIILDGFDEMKHLMSYSDFLRNFQQLNRLVTKKSKVILLGRPSAFLSDEERTFVLKGRRPVGKIIFSDGKTPEFDEKELSPFSLPQINSFVEKYVAFASSIGKFGYNKEQIRSRLEDVKCLNDEDLLSRPVHAKMFVDVAVHTDHDLSQINRRELYEFFVDGLIKREVEKPGRGYILKHGDRRIFACNLAWYLWTNENLEGGGCRLEELPHELFTEFLPHDCDIEPLKRDLLASSFLEHKSEDLYYFAHRSFQEFLVSEYIYDNCLAESSQAIGIMKKLAEGALSEEIFQFLAEAEDGSILKDFSSIMIRSKIEIDQKFINTIFSTSKYYEISSNKNSAQFGEFDAISLVFHYCSLRHENVIDNLNEMTRLLVEKCEYKPKVMIQSIFYFLYLCGSSRIAPEILGKVIFLLFYRFHKNLGKNSAKRPSTSSDSLNEIIFECVRAEFDDDKNLVMRLDYGLLTHLCSLALSNKVKMISREYDSQFYTDNFDSFFSLLTKEKTSKMKEFWLAEASRMMDIRH